MSVPFQPSLFGFGDPMADTSFGTLHRFQLDSESWVDLAPGWLRGADSLFTTLAESAPWQRRERWMYHRVAEPRLTCGWTVADAPRPLDDLGRVLSPALRRWFRLDLGQLLPRRQRLGDLAR